MGGFDVGRAHERARRVKRNGGGGGISRTYQRLGMGEAPGSLAG